MKVIIRYPKIYNTPLKVESVDTIEEALDLKYEVEQGFGQALILTDDEYNSLRETALIN